MALTEIKTSGIADDAVTTDKLANAINTERTANTAKPTLANDANNRVVTGDGSGGLNGEANLTFDGTNLGINQSSPGDLLEIHPASNNDGLTFKDTGDVYPAIKFDINRSGSDEFLGNIRGMWNGTTVANILLETGSDTTNKDDGVITFRTASAGSPAERLRIQSGGGISFNGDTAAANALEDYEEGTWVPTTNSNLTLNTSYDTFGYVKVGKMVTIRGYFVASAVSGTDSITLTLPFAVSDWTKRANYGGSGTMFKYVTGDYGTVAVYTPEGSSTMKFYRCQGDNSVWASVSNNHISTDTGIYFTHTYFHG